MIPPDCPTISPLGRTSTQRTVGPAAPPPDRSWPGLKSRARSVPSFTCTVVTLFLGSLKAAYPVPLSASKSATQATNIGGDGSILKRLIGTPSRDCAAVLPDLRPEENAYDAATPGPYELPVCRYPNLFTPAAPRGPARRCPEPGGIPRSGRRSTATADDLPERAYPSAHGARLTRILMRRSQEARKGAYGIRTRAAAVRGRCPRPLDECAGRRFSLAAAGKSRLMLGRWLRRGEKHRANKQQGDVHALDREGDPRGGVQSDDYRTADPRDVIEEGGTVMAAPGGAPQEGTSAEERRSEERS